MAKLLRWICGIVLTSSTASKGSSCMLWLAKSELNGAGRGVFLGKPVQAEQMLAVGRYLDLGKAMSTYTQIGFYSYGNDSSVIVLGPHAMLNHDRENQNVQLKVNPEGLVGVYALRAIDTGEELLTSYGPDEWFSEKGLKKTSVGAAVEHPLRSVGELSRTGTCLTDVGPSSASDAIVASRNLEVGEILVSPTFVLPRDLLPATEANRYCLGHPSSDVFLLPAVLPGRFINGGEQANLVYSLSGIDSADAVTSQQLVDSHRLIVNLEFTALRPIKEGEVLSIVYRNVNKDSDQSMILVRDGLFPAGWAESIDSLRLQAAEKGDSEAQFRLAQVLLQPIHGRPNPMAAMSWFQKAAESGHIVAQLELAKMYRYAKGVKVNHVKAIHWLRRAAWQGSTQAQFLIGISYFNGEGVEKNTSEGIRWIEQAYHGKDGSVMHNTLGEAYRDGNGVTTNKTEAVRWFTMAADGGHVGAMYSLADALAEGDGVLENPLLALRWYAKAAELGHRDAQYMMGLAYVGGVNVIQNDTIAATLFQKSAEQGNAESQYMFGTLCLHGRGVPRNWTTAAHWTQRAALAGNARAQLNLAQMYEAGRGVAFDAAEAERWYQKAEAQGLARPAPRPPKGASRHEL